MSAELLQAGFGARAPDSGPQGLSRGARRGVPGSTGNGRAPPQRPGHAGQGRGPGESPCGGSGDPPRPVRGAAARDPVRRQGPAGDEGMPTTWGAQPYWDQLRLRRHGRRRSWTRPAPCSAASWRWSSSPEASATSSPDASLHGPGLNALELRHWSGRLVERAGVGGRGRAGAVRDRLGDRPARSSRLRRSAGSPGCGRPTGGSSRDGAMALAWTLDKLGPMARSAEDCGLVLAAMAGVDPRDPTTRRAGTVPVPRRTGSGSQGAPPTSSSPRAQNFRATWPCCAPSSRAKGCRTRYSLRSRRQTVDGEAALLSASLSSREGRELRDRRIGGAEGRDA